MPMDLSSHSGIVAVIPAAGKGSRMESEVPKQYLTLGNQTILETTIDKFLNFNPVELVIVTVMPDDETWHQLSFSDNEKVIVIDGGKERCDSVLNALKFLYDLGLPDESPVMVHDAARPCIEEADIEKMIQAFEQDRAPKLMAAPIVDTIQKISNGKVQGTEDRGSLIRALTPQMAKFIDLKSALLKAESDKILVTDEVSALIHYGLEVDVVLGKSENIKITHKDDLDYAEFILKKQKSQQ